MTTPCICAFTYLEPSILEQRLHIDGCSIAELIKQHATPNIFKQEHAPTLTALVDRIHSSAEERNDSLCALRTAELLLTLPASNDGSSAISHDATDPISAVAEYMALHYRESISNHALAELSHLSESQLRRRFIASYGQPPHTFLNRLRCRIGAEMLSYTTRTIEDIADAVGYGSTTDFYRHFKTIFGISPSAWRNMRRR